MTYFDAFLLAATEELKQAPPAVAETIKLAVEREIIRESERQAALKRGLQPRQGEAVVRALESQRKH